jgi:hypothetical protein
MVRCKTMIRVKILKTCLMTLDSDKKITHLNYQKKIQLFSLLIAQDKLIPNFKVNKIHNLK